MNSPGYTGSVKYVRGKQGLDQVGKVPSRYFCKQMEGTDIKVEVDDEELEKPLELVKMGLEVEEEVEVWVEVEVEMEAVSTTTPGENSGKAI